MASDVTLDHSFEWLTICSVYASILAFTAIIVAFLLRKRRTCYYGGKYLPRPPNVATVDAAYEFRNLDLNEYKSTNGGTTSKNDSVVDFTNIKFEKIEKAKHNKNVFLEEQIKDVEVREFRSEFNQIQIVEAYEVGDYEKDTYSNPNYIIGMKISTNDFKFEQLALKRVDETGLLNVKQEIKYDRTLHNNEEGKPAIDEVKNFFYYNSNLNNVNLQPSNLQHIDSVNVCATNACVKDQTCRVSSFDTLSCLKYSSKSNDSVSNNCTKTKSIMQSNDDQMVHNIIANSLKTPLTYYGNVEPVGYHNEQLFNFPLKSEYESEPLYENHGNNYSDLSMNQTLLSNNYSTICNQLTEDKKDKVAINDTLDNTSIIRALVQDVISKIVVKEDVEDISERNKKISTFEKDIVDISEKPTQLYESVETDLSKKQMPKKRKTSVVVDKAGNISITLSPHELLDNSSHIPVSERTFVYESDLGNISVTQILPVDSTIEESNKSQFCDENSSMTEEIISCVILSDSEIQLKESFKEENVKDYSKTFSKLPRPKKCISYDLSVSNEQLLPPNIISTNNIKTTGNQDIKSKLDTKVHNQDTKYVNNEFENQFSAMIPCSLLFHKSEVESNNSTIFKNNNVLTTKELPTHVILSELKLKHQQYIIKSDLKNQFLIQFLEPASLILSEEMDTVAIKKEDPIEKIFNSTDVPENIGVYENNVSTDVTPLINKVEIKNTQNYLDEESNLSYKTRQITEVMKPVLNSYTSLQKNIAEKSSVTKTSSEHDLIAIMRTENIDKGTITSSYSVLLDAETSTTDFENVIKADFLLATQIPISSPEINSIAVDREQSGSLSKLISEDCINKDGSFYSDDFNMLDAYPILDTTNICPEEDKICADIGYMSITKSESTVIFEIQETVEKCIINDLLDMNDNDYSEIILDNNMTTIIPKHTDSNFQLKTLSISKYADNINFAREDNYNKNCTNESDYNGKKSDKYFDFESICLKHQFYGQSTLHEIGDIENAYVLIDANYQNNTLNHSIRNRYFEKVFSPDLQSCQDVDDTRQLQNIPHKVANTDKEDNQIQPLLSVVPTKNIPEMDSAPDKLVPSLALARGRVGLSPFGIKVQDCVETETSKGLFRLSTCEKNLTLQFEEDDLLKNNTKFSLTSPLRKTSPDDTSHKTDDTKKGFVIPSYLKDVSDGIKVLMSDLVKPVAEDLPLGTEQTKYITQNNSTSSMEIQTNIFTSSQIDLQPTSPYIIIPNQKSEDIVHKSENHTKFPFSSLDTTSASLPSELSNNKNKNIYTTSPIIQFDLQNPLNNVLLPPLNFTEYQYQQSKLSEYSEIVIAPLAKSMSGCTQTGANSKTKSSYESHRNSLKIPKSRSSAFKVIR